MSTFVAALGGVEFPREIDADATGVTVFAELCTDIDTSVSRHLGVAGMENVVEKDGYTEALVFEKLSTQTEVNSACGLRLRAARLIVGFQFHSDV